MKSRRDSVKRLLGVCAVLMLTGCANPIEQFPATTTSPPASSALAQPIKCAFDNKTPCSNEKYCNNSLKVCLDEIACPPDEKGKSLISDAGNCMRSKLATATQPCQKISGAPDPDTGIPKVPGDGSCLDDGWLPAGITKASLTCSTLDPSSQFCLDDVIAAEIQQGGLVFDGSTIGKTFPDLEGAIKKVEIGGLAADTWENKSAIWPTTCKSGYGFRFGNRRCFELPSDSSNQNVKICSSLDTMGSCIDDCKVPAYLQTSALIKNEKIEYFATLVGIIINSKLALNGEQLLISPEDTSYCWDNCSASGPGFVTSNISKHNCDLDGIGEKGVSCKCPDLDTSGIPVSNACRPCVDGLESGGTYKCKDGSCLNLVGSACESDIKGVESQYQNLCIQTIKCVGTQVDCADSCRDWSAWCGYLSVADSPLGKLLCGADWIGADACSEACYKDDTCFKTHGVYNALNISTNMHQRLPRRGGNWYNDRLHPQGDALAPPYSTPVLTKPGLNELLSVCSNLETAIGKNPVVVPPPLQKYTWPTTSDLIALVKDAKPNKGLETNLCWGEPEGFQGCNSEHKCASGNCDPAGKCVLNSSVKPN